MIKKPVIDLDGPDGNALALVQAANKHMRELGKTQKEIQAFQEKALSGDYGQVLEMCSKFLEYSYSYNKK